MKMTTFFNSVTKSTNKFLSEFSRRYYICENDDERNLLYTLTQEVIHHNFNYYMHEAFKKNIEKGYIITMSLVLITDSLIERNTHKIKIFTEVNSDKINSVAKETK